MWVSANNLSQDGPPKQQFISDLTSEMQQNVLPDAMDLGKQALSQINFQEEFSKVNARTPEVANAGLTQVKTLAKDLPDQSEKTIDDEFDSVMTGREAKLKADFPQATDAQLADLMTGITKESHDQVSILTDNLFTPHIQTLNFIVADLNTIESKDQPAKADIPTWQMVFLVSDLARSDFAQLQAQADAVTKENEKSELKSSKTPTKS
jgi:hypothetical protein